VSDGKLNVVSAAPVFLLSLLIFGLSAFASTNSTCPFPSLGDPDVFIDIPKLEIDKLDLYVENLDAKVTVAANVGNLVGLNVGVDASVRQINVSLSGVRAQLRVEARLQKIVDIIARTLTSLDKNPQLLLGLVNNIGVGVGGALNNLIATFNTAAGTVKQTIDSFGNVISTVTNSAGGVTQQIIGNYLTPALGFVAQGVPKPLENGNGTVQRYLYSAFGTTIDITFNALGDVIGTAVVTTGP
jgi:hypothetical protein